MKKGILLALLLVGIAFIICSNKANAGVSVNIGFFYSSLGPHGEWIEIEPGFVVWRPFHVHRYWRPYMLGRWVWTAYGWYWLSDEPFGWIVYHYGRWYYDDYYGWIWVPDDVWGPAWVEWRYDDDYIGWAPLPPYAAFRIHIGIRFTRTWVAPPHYWVFIRYKHFGRPITYGHIVSSERHIRRIIGRTRSIHQYRVENERVVHIGIDRTIIERRTRTPIREVTVKEVRERSGERPVLDNRKQNVERIEIYRPTREEIQRPAERPTIKRSERKPTLDVNEITRSRSETQDRDIQLQREQREKKSEQIQSEQKVEQEERANTRSQPRQQDIQKSKIDRQEKRKELIERQDNLPNPPVRERPGTVKPQKERQRPEVRQSYPRESQRSRPESRKQR